MDELEFSEAASNLGDLVSEYQQYQVRLILSQRVALALQEYYSKFTFRRLMSNLTTSTVKMNTVKLKITFKHFLPN